MDLDLVNNDSPFPKAIETCLKGMVANLRDLFFQVLRIIRISEVCNTGPMFSSWKQEDIVLQHSECEGHLQVEALDPCYMCGSYILDLNTSFVTGVIKV